jgi:hypothetical protein
MRRRLHLTLRILLLGAGLISLGAGEGAAAGDARTGGTFRISLFA